jgi:predicted nucleotide-binding protein
MARGKILFAENNAGQLAFWAGELRGAGYDVVPADNPRDARSQLLRKDVEFDLVILDIKLENDDDPRDYSGLELATEIPGVPKIILSFARTAPAADLPQLLSPRAQQLSIVNVLWKNCGTATLLRAVRNAIRPRIFIVHGHDTALVDLVRTTISGYGLRPIVLAQQSDGLGVSILRHLEQHAALVEAAVVLLTGDDVGAQRGKRRSGLKPRARQNVVLELGFFLAKLGASNVIPLYQDGVELPSDYGGIIWEELRSDGSWRQRLEEKLRSIGIDVSLYRDSSSPAPRG